jgi:MerR family transcriptional regulator, redox-sensitive transcriptional activator SoxR
VDDGRLTIGEVERRSGVKATTLRWYEEVGVLPAPERVSGQRRYPPAVLRRLQMVDAAQRAGCTLAEIAELFAAADGGAAGRLRELAARRRPEAEAQVERAHASVRWLDAASACDCATLEACGLFDPA